MLVSSLTAEELRTLSKKHPLLPTLAKLCEVSGYDYDFKRSEVVERA